MTTRKVNRAIVRVIRFIASISIAILSSTWMFAPSGFAQDVSFEVTPSESKRYFPGGRGWIPIADPAEYPRIPALDCDDPGSVLYTMRPNLLGIDVRDEWDFSNLINTDRPDFTDATFSVGENVTIIETGYTYRKIRSEDGVEVSKRRLPEFLVRRGITDELELRLRWNGYIMTDVRDSATGVIGEHYGTDDLILGFKYEIWQQQGWIPMLTLVPSVSIPTGTRDFSADQVQPSVNLVYGWGLRRWLYLKSSTTVDFLRNADIIGEAPGRDVRGPSDITQVDNTSEWHQSVSMLYQLSPRVGGFFEWWCAFQSNGADNRAAHFGDTGLFIYATPQLQFDVRVGQRFSDRVDHFFTGCGVSTRF